MNFVSRFYVPLGHPRIIGRDEGASWIIIIVMTVQTSCRFSSFR